MSIQVIDHAVLSEAILQAIQQQQQQQQQHSSSTSETVTSPGESNATNIPSPSLVEDGDDDEEDNDDDGGGPLCRWPHPAIELLLINYREMEPKFLDGNHTHKQLWNKIAKTVTKYGKIKVNGSQCSSKLRGMKKTYLSIKAHNSKPGVDKRMWPYLETMEEVLSQKDFCRPVSVASTSNLRKKRAIENSKKMQVSHVTSSEETVVTLLSKRLHQKERHEENRQKRHEERMAMDRKLLELLNKLAK